MELYSWGANSHGQLGQGHFKDTWVPQEVDDPEIRLSQISRISGGGGHTAFVSGGGELYLCGLNDQGQLGSSCDKVKSQPVPRPLCAMTVQKVACGWDFTLAISGGGQLWSWGSNSFGQTGQDITCQKISQPTIVQDLREMQFRDVSAGLRHAAAIASSGDVWVWGDAKRGQVPLCCLGPTVGRVSKPLKVLSTFKGAEQVHCGAFFTLLLTGEGEVFGWGDSSRGQLTWDPSQAERACFPISLDVPRCLALSVGWSHVLAISAQGKVFSWGRGDYGQLGRSCPLSGCDPHPAQVMLPCPALQVCCGSEHCLAVTEDKCLFVWGWNEHGMCGVSESVTSIPYPQPVSFGSKAHVTFVAAGAGYSFASLLTS